MQEERNVPRRHRTQNRLSRFVFTLNNYTPADVAALKSLTNVKWLIFGKEVGENGTPHLQGACVIGKQTAFSTVKKWPGLERAHIEPMHGTPQQSLDYCTKQDPEAYVYGDMPAEGKRNDLQTTINLLKEGKSIRDIVNSDDIASIATIVRYPKGLNAVANLLRLRERKPPIVVWLYGPTGVGKTRCAVEFAQSYTSGEYWMSSGSLRWFDGYDGQQVAIFDDLRTKHVEFSMLLRLLDRYPMRVEIKGGCVQWIPEVIIVTAPYNPDLMWNLRRNEDIEQLNRRVTHCLLVTPECQDEVKAALAVYLPVVADIHSDDDDVTLPFSDEQSLSEATDEDNSEMSLEEYNAFLARDRATVSLVCDEDLSSVPEFNE